VIQGAGKSSGQKNNRVADRRAEMGGAAAPGRRGGEPAAWSKVSGRPTIMALSGVEGQLFFPENKENFRKIAREW
jgi:hypothetical protein